ncbi:MAG: hypothetical protein ABI851_00445 [Saprospiraceae bacterium]
MKNKSLILLSIVLITACHNDDPILSDKVPYGDGSRTKVDGRVFEFGSNKPLVNCMVVLKEEFHEPFSGGGIYYTIDTTYTDSIGYYVFDFKHMKKDQVYSYSYVVEAIQPLYFSGGNSMEEGFWNKNRDIILDPYAWIKVHIKNVNPFDEKDYLWLGGGGDYYGININTSEVNIKFGNHSEEFVWYIGKNGIQVKKSDTVFVAGHDTLTYEILY